MTSINARSVLVIGGARSGKSLFAETLARDAQRAHGAAVTYIATADVQDEDFARRVAIHQTRRPTGWETREEPLQIAPIVAGGDRTDLMLIDCATLWLTNQMLAEADMAAEVEALTAAIETTPAKVIVVSNEVGQGIVPGTAMGRQFRDLQGSFNARCAEAVDAVIKIQAGLPQFLKPAPTLNIW